MKLPDFGESEELNKLREEIDAPRIEWRPATVWDSPDLQALVLSNKEFTTGRGINSSELLKLRKTWQSEAPFVDAEGRSFVLYIYDQSLANQGGFGDREYKFHFCWCSTLQTMQAGGRGGRYKAKFDVDNNIFTVYQGRAGDAQKPMRVCMNCLSSMNHQNCLGNYVLKNRLSNEFNIKIFFSEHGPQHLPQPTHQYHAGGYTADWDFVSRRKKEECGYVCQKCKGSHSFDKSFLQTHHKNGVKSDNSDANLIVLCKTCHAAEPFHGHMRSRSSA